MVHLLAALPEPIRLGLIHNLVEASVAASEKDAAVGSSLNARYRNVVGVDDEDGFVHQLHLLVDGRDEGFGGRRDGLCCVTERHPEHNNFGRRCENQQVFHVVDEDIWFRLDETDADDELAEAIEICDVSGVLVRPNVDVRVDCKPSSSDLGEESHSAVALDVCKG